MLSIALQKMIDKVEAVFFLNTDNTVQVCSDTQMKRTYSPWIYAEIIYTQFLRKKPLLAYRNYTKVDKEYFGVTESVQFAMHSVISYAVSLEHLKLLEEGDLNKWENEFSYNKCNYEYALDALYGFICTDEVKNTKNLFFELKESEISVLQHAYSAKKLNEQELEAVKNIRNQIIREVLLCCHECYRLRETLNE